MRGITILLLCALCAVLAHGASYDPYFTRSLGVFYPSDDTLTNHANVLFRSNVPENSERHFEYHELLDVMIEKAREERKVMVSKDNVYMVVISLVEDTNSMLASENQYFVNHPHRGEHINWQVIGQGEDPAGASEARIRKQVETLDWMNTDLESLVSLIQERLTDFSKSKNTFIVIHDEAGYVHTSFFLPFPFSTFIIILTFCFQT